ncbi:glycosyltransferase [Marinobacter sp.]|uniref:glycosyltransferase family 4 protein n=1 Tax=Marinobacter sp. TaxID=50741 RepID=UPI0023553163|nr:glycosyltransferase [Marinobacter sp.]
MNSTLSNKRVLFLAGRDFLSQNCGRAMVLKTYLEIFVDLGFNVDLVVFGDVESIDKYQDYEGVVVSSTGKKNIRNMISVLSSLLLGTSVNRGFFRHYSIPKSRFSIDYDYVYVDSIRLVDQGRKISDQVIVDLDDFYSRRYRQMVSRGIRLDILGYWGDGLPIFIRKLGNLFAFLLLKREARILEAEECLVPSLSKHTFLVSKSEAKFLSRKDNQNVADMPMAISESPISWSKKVVDNRMSMCFVGSPKYQQNYQSLLSASVILGREEFKWCKLFVAGDISGVNLGEFSENIEFVGFVEDVHDFICGHDCYFSPIDNGTGIKTKNLEAASCGIPIVTTEIGVEGTDLAQFCYLIDGVSGGLAEDVIGFVNDFSVETSMRQMEYISKEFSFESCKLKLAKIL